jgi:hypothetical protein
MRVSLQPPSSCGWTNYQEAVSSWSTSRQMEVAAEEHDTDPDMAPELVTVDDVPAESCERLGEHPHVLSLPRGGRDLVILVHGLTRQ